MSYHASPFYHRMLKGNFFYIARFQETGKNALVATIQTKWKHIPAWVDIMTQKHLGRSEPIYEHFSQLRSRVLGGSRRPQLARLTTGRLKSGGEDPTIELNVDNFYSGNGN